MKRLKFYGGVLMAKKENTPDKGGTFNISGSHNSVVVGSSDVGMTHGAESGGGEMEDDLVRVFRGFTMREKTRFLQGAYDFEDQCVEDREKEKQK